MPGDCMIFVIGLWTFVRALLFGSAAIALENLALRHQLLVLQRSVSRPHLSRWDRVLWVWLSRVWVGWRSSLAIVQPATVLVWRRRGFQLYWRSKSRAKPVGRPRLDPEVRQLIRRMARENPTWGRRRIQAELALLGYDVAELTVAKYMHRASPRPSPTWRAFLTAHAPRYRRHRLLPRADPHLSPALHLRGPAARPPRTPPPRRHRPSHGHPGQLSNSSRCSRMTRLRPTCFVIVTVSTAMSSCAESRAWRFTRS
jgi:Homeodomain-like domain